jgi:hypothetical protein
MTSSGTLSTLTLTWVVLAVGVLVSFCSVAGVSVAGNLTGNFRLNGFTHLVERIDRKSLTVYSSRSCSLGLHHFCLLHRLLHHHLLLHRLLHHHFLLYGLSHVHHPCCLLRLHVHLLLLNFLILCGFLNFLLLLDVVNCNISRFELIEP